MSFSILSETDFYVSNLPGNTISLSNHNTLVLNGGFYNDRVSFADSQKARGVLFLMSKSATLSAAFDWKVPRHVLFDAGTLFDDHSFNYPVFARPCPTVPRHGFVDSVSCSNAKELNKVSMNALNAEENAELMVTKPISASYNAIITDGVITFSYGNDGATSGKDVKYFYISGDPIAPVISLDTKLMLNGEVPFYELVLDNIGETYLVQVRSGPGVPRCKDYVQERTEVKKIIKAEGDLLDWETLLKNVDPRTTIVDHTSGSLSSHYAVHAIINKIPIFTSYLPKFGDFIEPTVINNEITEEDREKFYRAFCYGFSSGKFMSKNSKFYSDNAFDQMNGSLILALATLHNFSSIAMAKDYEVVGITLGLFLRGTFTVSAGEARFAKVAFDAPKDLRDFHSSLPKDRKYTYNYIYNLDTSKFIDNIELIYRIFSEISWSGGYGGPKWLSCTQSSIDLFNACVSKNISGVVELFNKVIHEEHNGGKYLNKIINVSMFNSASENPSIFAVKNVKTIIDMLSTVWSFARTTDDSSIPWGKFKKLSFCKKINPLKKSVGTFGINAIKAVVNNGVIEHLNISGTKIPENIVIKIAKVHLCHLENGEYYLDSKPYKWVLSDSSGTFDVISKNMLKKLIENHILKN